MAVGVDRLRPVVDAILGLRLPPAAFVAICQRSASPAMLGLVKTVAEVSGKRDWQAAAGQVLGTQATTASEVNTAVALLRGAASDVRLTRGQQELLADLLVLTSQPAVVRALEAEGVLDGLPDGRRHLLAADLVNPFDPGSGSTGARGEDEWLARVAAFTGPDLAVALAPAAEAADSFDRLRGAGEPASLHGPLVSVVVSSYRPGHALLTAVRSLLAQTWADLEVLVVDDASGEEFAGVFRSAERLDPRVRVIHQPRNGGTYMARNTAIDQARGVYVTFQDSDDWSHPERVAREVAVLEADSLASCVRTVAVRASEHLRFARQGNSVAIRSAPTLMFRRKPVWEALGGYDEVRKAADTEFHRRIELAVPGRTVDLDDVLLWMRMSDGSLSREEFRPGWRHPARVAYRSAYEHWHQRIIRGASPRLERSMRPFPVPRRYSVHQDAPADYDLVVLADWRVDSPQERDAADWVRLLAGTGVRIALLHAESIGIEATRAAVFARHVQELVAEGVADVVLWDEEVEATAAVAVSPHVLEFLPGVVPGLRARAIAVLLDVDRGCGSDPLFPVDLNEIEAVVKERFGSHVVWSPRAGVGAPTQTGAPTLDGALPIWVPPSNAARPGRLAEPVVLVTMLEETQTLIAQAGRLVRALAAAGVDVRVRISGPVVPMLMDLVGSDLGDRVLCFHRADLAEQVQIAVATDVVVVGGPGRTSRHRLAAEALASGARVHVAAGSLAVEGACEFADPEDLVHQVLAGDDAASVGEAVSEKLVTAQITTWYRALIARAMGHDMALLEPHGLADDLSIAADAAAADTGTVPFAEHPLAGTSEDKEDCAAWAYVSG